MKYDPKIPKKALMHGHYYQGRCRNATVARWNGATERFYHWRTKFGNRFIEEIFAPEDEKIYDVFVAERDLTVAHETVELIPFPGEYGEK